MAFGAVFPVFQRKFAFSRRSRDERNFGSQIFGETQIVLSLTVVTSARSLGTLQIVSLQLVSQQVQARERFATLNRPPDSSLTPTVGLQSCSVDGCISCLKDQTSLRRWVGALMPRIELVTKSGV